MSSLNEPKYDRLVVKKLRRAADDVLEIEIVPFLLSAQFFVFLDVAPPKKSLKSVRVARAPTASFNARRAVRLLRGPIVRRHANPLAVVSLTCKD